MMYSAVLDSFSKKDFLTLVRAASESWETDAVYSGDGYQSEDLSVCFISPRDRLLINQDTSIDDIKSFVFADDKLTLGFLSYDYGLYSKQVASNKVRDIEYGQLKKYSAYAKHRDETLTLEADTPVLLEKIIAAFESYTHIPEQNIRSKSECNMTSDEYIGKVEEVIDYIRDGQTYQLNLSMMYEAEVSVAPMNLWADIAEANPAPFYSYINTEEGAILSTSPERFLKVDEGTVLSQPIKGTYRFEEYSPELEKLLTDSKKESAELSMIVDLIRNDISETCEVGSVKVLNHKAVMRVDNLLQMYSDVTGKLKEDTGVVDLLLSAFPGGSITGCPKKRSMELIEELEPHSRGIYCGSIFTIQDKLNMDSSIAIRTGFYKGGLLRFYAGSGIVADSVPESEFNESVSKAEKFLELFS